MLFFLLAKNFYNIVTTSDDQNSYLNPPSRIYLTKPLVNNKLKTEGINESLIDPGVFILSLNNKRLSTEIQIYRYLDEFDQEDNIEFVLYRFSPSDSSLGFLDTIHTTKSQIQDDFFKYLYSCVVVLDVLKGGVSDVAGLQKGDIITHINGKIFSSGEDAHRMVAGNKRGEDLVYSILRNNNQKQINIELARFQLPIDYLLTLIFGLVYMLLGLWIGYFRPAIYSARLIGGGLLLFGLSLSLLSYGEFTLILFEFLGLLNIYIARFALVFSIPIIVHSLVYFPFERKGLKNRFYLIKIPYIVSISVIIVQLADIIYPIGDFTGFLVVSVLVFYGLWYPIVFIAFRDKSKPFIKGSKSIIVSVIIVYFYLVAQVFSDNFGIVLPKYFICIYLLLPISYIFTIAKYGLFDELIKLNKNIQHSVLRVILNFSILLIVLFSVLWFAELEIPIPNIHFNGKSIEVLDHPMTEDSQELYEKILLIIFVIFLGFVLNYLKNRILDNLNKYYHVFHLDYQDALNQLNEAIQTKSNINDLSKSISLKLIEILKIKRSGVIFFENEQKILSQFFFGVNDQDLKEYTLIIEKELISSLNEFSGNLLIEYLPEKISKIFLDCNYKYIIPIRAKTKLMGILIIGEKKSEANYRTEDLSFLSSIAKQAAISVENVYLYSDLANQERIHQELEIARRIQLSSLPQDVPSIRGLDIAGYSIPALEVGGDFYDFYQDSENDFILTAVIGDVSGKGTSAALYMSKIQGIMRTLQEFRLSPQKLLIKTNFLIYNYLEKGAFITAACLEIDSIKNKIKLSRAGHLPLYHFDSKSKKIKRHIPKGLVLGMNKNDLFNRNLEELEIDYNKNDFFVLVTDGILEARNINQTDYQEEKLLSVLEDCENLSAKEIERKIIDSVEEYTGRENQFDDITTMVIKAL
ncbi:SpoIIE family protein phosphatase [Candidatus Kapabacteria bacterium]|nr:SpoIIE family protein phosphatase [Candidatus Kapabacteria bacterium]